MTDDEFAAFEEPVGAIADVERAELSEDGSMAVYSVDNLWIIKDDAVFAGRLATYLRSKGIPVSFAGL